MARESQQDDKNDPQRAAITERQNSALIHRLIANGTTTALYFGTLRLDSTLKLAEQLAKVNITFPTPKYSTAGFHTCLQFKFLKVLNDKMLKFHLIEGLS